MRCVAVINQKGGAGKSTLSIHLAVAATQQGLATAIIDLDGQATSAEWGDRRDADLPVVISTHAARLERELEELRSNGCEVVFIDTMPRADNDALRTAMNADLVVIPCEPNILEMDPTIRTIGWLKRDTSVPFFVVLNKVAINGAEAGDAEEFLRTTHETPVCATRLHSRKAFFRSIAEGLGVTEYEPEGKAAQEIQQLYMSICPREDVSTSQQIDMPAQKEAAHAQQA